MDSACVELLEQNELKEALWPESHKTVLTASSNHFFGAELHKVVSSCFVAQIYDIDYSFIFQKIIHKNYLQNVPRCTAGNSSIKFFTERVLFFPLCKRNIYVCLFNLK